MSFIDSAAELIDRTEAALSSLITEALRAKAYREITTIAAMAESVAAITSGRSREAKRPAMPPTDSGIGTQTGSVDPAKAAEPFWMRPKTP